MISPLFHIYLQADRLGTNLCISDITFCKSTLHIWCCSFCLAVSFTNLSCSVCAITARFKVWHFSLLLIWHRPSNCGRSKETCACQVFFNLLPQFWPQMPQQWAHKEKEELVFPSTMRMSREKGKASFDFLLFTSRSHFGRSVGGLWPRSFLFVAAALHCWPPTTDQLQTKTFSAQKEKQGQLFVTDLVLISFHSLPNRNLDRSLISFS